MAERQCERCGKPFEAERSTRRYCGSGCRAITSTEKPTPVIGIISDGTTPEPGPITTATRDKFREADRLDHPWALTALTMAAQLDNAAAHTPASLAHLTKSFHIAWEAAMDGVTVVRPDVLDRIKAEGERRKDHARQMRDDAIKWGMEPKI